MAKNTKLGKDEKGPLFQQFLLELLESQDLMNEFMKYVEEPAKFNPGSARKILGALVSDNVRPFWKNEFDGLLTLMKEQNDRLAAIGADLKRNNALISHLASDRLEIESLMSISPEALKRYKEEYFEEKRTLAKYVVERFFSAPLNCFFQASTTVFHLVEELPNDPRILSGTVIHSNSYALPYFVLGQLAFRKCNVYPVCGQIKDFKCCGWLYDSFDQQADEYLRGVGEKVAVAFITPQYMDAQGHLYFAREQTVNLVQSIWETAKRIVILTPAARVMEGENSLPSAGEISWTKFFPPVGKVELITAGKPQHLAPTSWENFQANHHDRFGNQAVHLHNLGNAT